MSFFSSVRTTGALPPRGVGPPSFSWREFLRGVFGGGAARGAAHVEGPRQQANNGLQWQVRGHGALSWGGLKISPLLLFIHLSSKYSLCVYLFIQFNTILCSFVHPISSKFLVHLFIQFSST